MVSSGRNNGEELHDNGGAETNKRLCLDMTTHRLDNNGNDHTEEDDEKMMLTATQRRR